MDRAFLTYTTDVLGDTNTGLSGSQIATYCSNYAVEFGISIPYATYPFEDVPNKRTALNKNLLCFSDEQQFRIIKELMELAIFKDNANIGDLKKRLFARYGHLSKDKISDTELIQKTKHWLGKYPRALEQYNNALIKFEGDIYHRNTLDDMRLSFEFLVKDLLKNEKSLENQIAEIGQRLKVIDISNELRNTVTTTITYYTKFQNNNVKHGDNINANEIEYVIEQTSIIMKFLIKTLGGQTP